MKHLLLLIFVFSSCSLHAADYIVYAVHKQVKYQVGRQKNTVKRSQRVSGNTILFIPETASVTLIDVEYNRKVTITGPLAGTVASVIKNKDRCSFKELSMSFVTYVYHTLLEPEKTFYTEPEMEYALEDAQTATVRQEGQLTERERLAVVQFLEKNPDIRNKLDDMYVHDLTRIEKARQRFQQTLNGRLGAFDSLMMNRCR